MSKIKLFTDEGVKSHWKAWVEKNRANKEAKKEKAAKSEKTELDTIKPVIVAGAPMAGKSTTVLKTGSDETKESPKTEDAPEVNPQDKLNEGKREDVLRKTSPLWSLLPSVSVYGGAEYGFSTAGNWKNKGEEFENGTVLKGAGIGENYNFGALLSGQFEPWGISGSRPITVDWKLDAGYKQTPLNNLYYSDYDYTVVLPPNMSFQGKGGYQGFNLFGVTASENKNSVPDKLFLSRANPDYKDWVTMDGRFNYFLFDNKLRLTAGFDAQGGFENYYETSKYYGLRTETDVPLGIGVKIGGFDIYAEGSVVGTEIEEVQAISESEFGSSAPSIDQRIKNSRSRDLQVYRMSVDTPKIGPVDFKIAGEYKSYGNLVTQWNAGVDASFDQWRIGLKYEDNPILYIGENNRWTLSTTYSLNPLENVPKSPASLPIDLTGKVMMITAPDGKQYWGATVGFEITADLLKHRQSSSGPIYVEKHPEESK